MVKIEIPDIKVISQNQKMQARAYMRKGSRERLRQLLIAFSVYDSAAIDHIMKFFYRESMAMVYKTGKFKKFENDLRNKIIAGIKGERRKYKNNVIIKIKIKTYLDIDNSVKAILDNLFNAGLLENDRDVLKLGIIKYPAKRGGRESITIEISDGGEGEKV